MVARSAAEHSVSERSSVAMPRSASIVALVLLCRALRKPQIYRWLLMRAITRSVVRRVGDTQPQPDRRRWNFPTRQRRRLGDA